MRKFKKVIAPVLAVLLFSGSLGGSSIAAGETKSVTVAQPVTNIVGDISIVHEVNSDAELATVMKAERLPSTVILNVDKTLKVLGSGGQAFATVEEAIAELGYKVLPVFCVTDRETVDGLVGALGSLNFYDVCIMSKDASLVRYARDLMPAVRGAIDFTEVYKDVKTLSDMQLVEIRKETIKNNGYVAVLPAELCEREVVQHLYDGRISVWAKLSEDAKAKEQYKAVLSGAMGVISDESDELLKIVCDKLEADTLTRASLNVGHKGIPSKSLENTIEGGQAAVKAGADALEIDVYMTKDKEVVIMHDYKTGGTCDRDLVIADSTLAELKELWVVKNEDGTGIGYNPCRIPTLEEFFQEFGNDDVRFFIEFKGGGQEIVKAVRDLVNEYGMYDRCTTIAFDAGVMKDIRELWPEMPISYLTYTMPIDEANADSAFATVMQEIGKYNATFSPSIYTQGSRNGSHAALIRGVMINGWTYENQSTYLVSYMSGASSITGDDASFMAEYPISLAVKNLKDGMEINKGESITLDVDKYLYNGKNAVDSDLDCLVIEGNGVVIMNGNQLTFNKAGEITFVLEYQHPITTINVPTLYSEPITVTVIGTEEDTEDKAPGQDGKEDGAEDGKTEGTQKEDKDNISTGDKIFKMIPLLGGVAIVSLAVIVLLVYKKKRA